MDEFKGEGWWQGFMKRHSELSLRSSDPLSSCRSNAVTQNSLDYYYALLKETLEKNVLMNNSSRIYNMDETGMPLDSKQFKFPKRNEEGIRSIIWQQNANNCLGLCKGCRNNVAANGNF